MYVIKYYDDIPIYDQTGVNIWEFEMIVCGSADKVQKGLERMGHMIMDYWILSLVQYWFVYRMPMHILL